MMVDRTVGTLICKKGDVSQRLSIDIKPDEADHTKLDLLVVTKVYCKKQNPNAAALVELLRVSEGP